MSHTYASVEDFRQFLIDGGDSDWTDADSTILTLLEGASRRIEEWADRSQFGSGFGPRTGTNRYDFPADATTLRLDDDLLAITSISAVSGGGTVTLTDETQVYKLPYDTTPYRELTLVTTGSGSWGSDQRGNLIAGTWGYSNETASLGTAAGSASASATSLVLGGGSAYAGNTLLIGSEQLYVTASGGTATVVRGVNGTTAGTVALGTAISVYRYPRGVVTACLQIAQRRHRSAQSGLTGDFGGGAISVTSHRDSEMSILKATMGALRRWSAG